MDGGVFVVFSVVLLLVPSVSLNGSVELRLREPIVPILIGGRVGPAVGTALVRASGDPCAVQRVSISLRKDASLSSVISITICKARGGKLVSRSHLVYEPMPTRQGVSFASGVRIGSSSLSF